MALASVGGPVLAGVLIHADIAGSHWRSVFFINVPLGIIALAGALRYVPESRAEHRPRLDPVGMVLVSLAGVLLIYPLVQGRASGWPAWTFGCMAASPPVLGVFWWWEKRVTRLGGSPLVVVDLLAKRAFTGSLAVGVFFFAAMNGLLLVFGIYLQLGLGWSPTRAGLAIAPIAFGVAVGAVAAGASLVPRFGRRVLHAGAAVMAVGVAVISLTLHGAGTDVGGGELTPGLLVTGVGMGLFLSPFFDFALASVEDHETGSASGVLHANQQLGATIGVAVLGTLFFALAGGQMTAASHAAAPTLRDRVAAAGAPAGSAAALPVRIGDCDRALVAETDPASVPVDCRRLDTATRQLAAKSDRPDAVRSAVAGAEDDTRAAAFTTARERALWSLAGTLLVVGALAFLLPRTPREEPLPDPGPAEDSAATASTRV